MVFGKKSQPPKEVVKDIPKVVTPEKTAAHCVNDGCYELKAEGQTHVCAKHVRSS